MKLPKDELIDLLAHFGRGHFRNLFILGAPGTGLHHAVQTAIPTALSFEVSAMQPENLEECVALIKQRQCPVVFELEAILAGPSPEQQFILKELVKHFFEGSFSNGVIFTSYADWANSAAPRSLPLMFTNRFSFVGVGI